MCSAIEPCRRRPGLSIIRKEMHFFFCKGKFVGSGFVVLRAVHGGNVSICTGLDNKIYFAINRNEENPLLRKSSIMKFTKMITKVLS